MKAKSLILVILSVVFTTLVCWAQQPQSTILSQTSTSKRAQPNYGHLPLMFEANQGQTNSQVRFFSQGKKYSVFLTSGAMILALRPSEVPASADASDSPAIAESGRWPSSIHQLEKSLHAQKIDCFHVYHQSCRWERQPRGCRRGSSPHEG